MISPISFSSTYKVNNINAEAFSKFFDYANKKAKQNNVTTSFDSYKISPKSKSIDEQTLIVPDSMDNSVETYCKNNGISYKKFETKDLLDPKTVERRIEAPNRYYTKVNVDADKLEALIKNQDSNIPHCKSEYDKYYCPDVDRLIKSGNIFPTTTLFINPMMSNEDFKNYVDTFGIENLNDEQVMIDFCQLDVEPDHCVYFGLRDLGMNKIPVYVDKESYEAGKILGLF